MKYEESKDRKKDKIIYLFLIFELIGEPVEAFVEAVSACGARGLNVPVSIT